MYLTKLSELINKLNLTELILWVAYLKSLNESNSIAINYLEFIIKNHHQLVLASETLTNLSEKFYKKNKLNDRQSKKLISDVYKSSKNFILKNLLKNQEINNHIALIEFYRDRQLTKEMELAVSETYDLINNNHEIEAEKFYYLNKVNTITSNINILNSSNTDSKDLVEKDYNLDCYFISLKLMNIISSLNTQLKYTHNKQLAFENYILNFLETDKKYQNNILIDSLVTTIYLLQNRNNSDYEKLKNLTTNSTKNMSFRQSKMFFSILQNHCAIEINKGNDSFYNELFEIYKIQIQQKILLSQNHILNHDLYLNIITTSLRLGQIAWAEDFLITYKKYIIDEFQLDAFNLNKARITFYKKEYTQVIELLSQIQYINIFYNIDARKLLIQTYYELKEWNVLNSTINSFKIFLHRNQSLSERHITSNKNFANFILKLILIPFKNHSRAIKLEKELSKTTLIAERFWLYNKINELKESV